MRWPTILVLLILSGPALAHGGRYVGPVGEVPPDDRLPADWPPPETGGTGPTPPPGGEGRPGEVMGGGTPRKFDAVSFESWRFAWHLRENAVVEARAREFRRAPQPQAESLSARTVEQRILPALRAAAGDDREPWVIVEAGILGLVRTGDAEATELLRATAVNAGAERRHRRVEEAGILALGFPEGPAPANADVLLSIAAEPEEKTRSRAWACIALGLFERGSPSLDTLRMLEARLFDEGEGWYSLPNTAASAAFALGRLGTAEAAGILRRYLDAPPPPTKRRAETGADLREPVLRCQVAAALGRAAGASGDAGAAEDALASLSKVARAEGGLPAQGAAIGLGFLGAGASPGIAAKCVGLIGPLLESESADGQVRRFSSLALSRIAALGPAPARDAALEILVRSLAAARPTPSWAALAAGFAGEGRTAAERAPLARGVRRLWDAPPTPRIRPVEDRGACLLAMGLLRDLSARPLLEEVVGDAGTWRELREYAATALGLLGDPASIPALRAVLKDRVNRGWRRSIVVALGVLGDAASVPAILDVLRDPKSSTFVMGGCAQALGFLRDGGAVGPLTAVVENRESPDLTRAMALHALARMAAGPRPDPFADLSEDVPYRACTDALVELWSIL